MYDLIIIGAGPAGLSAAVYAARAQMDFIVIDASMMTGGQVLTTYDVDNYLGFKGIGGFEMGTKFGEHAKSLGATFVTEKVIGIETTGDIKKVVTDKNSYETKTIILATGADHKKGQVKGEEEFSGKGVSYCATCDGAFFRNKICAVVGGGDVALEDALYLARLCSRVYLIHRRDEFRAAKSTVAKVKGTENITILTDSVIDSIEGDNRVTNINVFNKKTTQTERIDVNGVFFAVGMRPITEYVDKNIQTDENGYIIAGEDCKTNIPGVFAAGDIRTKEVRQIITAAADGAYALHSVEKYLQ